MLETGERAFWNLSSAGLYVLDPDANGGPSIDFFPFADRRREVLRLPGKPDGYAGFGGMSHQLGLAISPVGRWILYLHLDRNEFDIMLVENFR